MNEKMSLELPASSPDLFAQSMAGIPSPPANPYAAAAPLKVASTAATVTLGSVLSAVLKDNVQVRKQMTAAEQAAVDAVIKNVGTPDEYGTSVEYILRALPYVRSSYSAMDVIQPIMPTDVEISILMRKRFLSA